MMLMLFKLPRPRVPFAEHDSDQDSGVQVCNRGGPARPGRGDRDRDRRSRGTSGAARQAAEAAAAPGPWRRPQPASEVGAARRRADADLFCSANPSPRVGPGRFCSRSTRVLPPALPRWGGGS
jgi:hypothetical protein